MVTPYCCGKVYSELRFRIVQSVLVLFDDQAVSLCYRSHLNNPRISNPLDILADVILIILIVS